MRLDHVNSRVKLCMHVNFQMFRCNGLNFSLNFDIFHVQGKKIVK